ncbi:MAG: tyrosine-type recombinase/integrase [Clostridia bacterium]|nr:tyrosine-type recombinase/integrase [Clostridia bacterium]
MENSDFYLERDENLQKRINDIVAELPKFCENYFVSIESSTSTLTRLNYAYDLRLFFNYLVENLPKFNAINVKDFTIDNFIEISSFDIEKYLSWLNVYRKEGKKRYNQEKGKSRKLSSIKSLYKYCFKKDLIPANTAEKVTAPKIHEKAILRLEPDEMVKVLDEVNIKGGFSKHQQNYISNTKKRDEAIFYLFLGTGIRISELVGINIEDINFEINSFKVTRKGGNSTILYFTDEVKEKLIEYLPERNQILKDDEIENAFFISLQKKRISVRAVQNIVKKYSQIAVPLKNITPHKLRSTFGTNLYKETNDIYMVATLLGHKDINTTRKHYAAINDDMKREATKSIKLKK